MKLRPVGRRALQVELDDLAQVQELHAALLARRAAGNLPGIVDIVPAARTILLDGVADPAEMAAVVAAIASSPADRPAPGPVVEVPVIYDGEDLDDVAARWGTSPAGAIALHAGTELRVAFCGFAPGFAYLVGLPERCHLPRRPTPRPRVPAGAVAVAGEFTAVYPRASPGGWHLLGHTPLNLWDPLRRPPALLAPGDRVRFVPVTT